MSSELNTQTTPWREALLARIRLEALPPEKFSHQARLYALTVQIAAAGPALDDDVLFAAAWSHDLGVFTGHRPSEPELLKRWNSTAYTLTAAGPLLLECGFPAEKLDAAIECIRTHEAQYEPTTPEGVVMRDADLLEQLGAVAVMRTVAKIAQDTRFITFADAARSLRRALETVPSQMKLVKAKELAAQRIAALQGFLDALDAESGGLLGFETGL